MIISFLQAGNGDCIHIKSGTHHVIIDSGEKCQELSFLIEQIIKSREEIDLLIITHYDSDHIKAIIDILDGMAVEVWKNVVKKVWFNATKIGCHGNEKLLSANDATKLSKLLTEADIDWVSEMKSGDKKVIDKILSIEVLEGGEIYQSAIEGQLLGNEKCDWNTSLKELEQYLDDEVLDKSKTNAQSAILMVNVSDKYILLPGDATPDKLLKALEGYGKGKSLKIDLVKLPHHGSYKNISMNILQKFECSDYVVSTNGAKYFHPDKKMMLKVIKWGRTIEGKQLTFHFNYYDELWKSLNITETEKRSYNFECDGQRTFEF